ncbi:MAG: phage tail tape measure protein [Planktomarina sp.]
MAVGDLNIALILKMVDQVSGPMKTALSHVQRFGTITDRVGRQGVEWTNRQIAANQANRAALQGQAFGLVATGAAMGGLLRPAIQFEKAMDHVGAVANASDSELALMSQTARQLGATTSWSASQAAEGMKYLAMAGFDANETIEAMPGMLSLASAGALDLGRTSDIASDILTGFGMKADQMGYLGDVLTNTFTSSNTDLSMLGETMKYVAPIAAGLDVSLEQTAAMAGKLGDAGIKASMSGTALRAILSRLSAPTTAAAAKLEKLGVQVSDTNGNLRDVPTILAEMDHAMRDMGTAARTEFNKVIFGEEASAAAAVLLGQAGSGSLQAYAESLHEVGAAARVAKQMNDNTDGALKRLASASEALAISLGTFLLPELVNLIDTVIPVIAALQAWGEANPELITLLGKLAGATVLFMAGSVALRWAVLALIMPFLKLAKGAFWLLRGLPMLGTAVAWLAKGPLLWLLSGLKVVGLALLRIGLLAMANPIGILITSIAALAYVVYQNWDSIVSYFDGKISSIKSAFDEGLINGTFKILSELNPFTLAYDGADGLFKYVTGWSFGDIFNEITQSAPFQNALASADAFLIKTTGWSLAQVWDSFPSLNPFTNAITAAEGLWTYISNWDVGKIVTDMQTNFATLNLYQIGVDALQSLWDGMLSLLQTMVLDIQSKLTGMLPEWMKTYVLGDTSSDPEGHRDAGGPVRAGFMYQVNERGQEFFVPGMAGSILPARAVQMAAATSLAAMPSVAAAVDTQPSVMIDKRPPLAAPMQAAAPIQKAGDHITIHIHAQPGQSGQDIAAAVEQALRKRDAEKRGDLFDTGSYQ